MSLRLEKPRQPTIEDFGLSDEFFRRREKHSGIVHKWTTIAGIISVAALAMTIVSNNKPLTDWLAITIVATFWGAIGIVLVLLILSSLLLGALELRDPEHASYREWESALQKYYENLRIWEKTQEEWWRGLSGRQFEAELALVFNKRGYQVVWTGRSGDGGVDLILSQDGKKILVQCKNHKRPIGPAPVRDLFGVLTDRAADEAWLISASGFSENA